MIEKTPDLSHAGIIAVLVVIIGLTAHRLGIMSLPRGLNIRFALIMAFVGVGAFLGYRDEFLESALGPLAFWTARITQALVQGLGMEALREGTVLTHPNGFAYQIAYSCTGVLPIVMFIACVLAYPGRWPRKCVGIVFGVPLLGAVNLLRLAHLFYVGVYMPGVFSLMHEVVWEGLQAVAVLALWLSWIRWSEVASRPLRCGASFGFGRVGKRLTVPATLYVR